MFMALDKMPAAGDYGTLLAQFLPLVVLIVVFYFVLIRPQRKRDKQGARDAQLHFGWRRDLDHRRLYRPRCQHQGRHAGHRVLERPPPRLKIYRWAIHGKEAPATETVEAPKEAKDAKK